MVEGVAPVEPRDSHRSPRLAGASCDGPFFSQSEPTHGKLSRFFSRCKSRPPGFRKFVICNKLRLSSRGLLHHPPPHKWGFDLPICTSVICSLRERGIQKRTPTMMSIIPRINFFRRSQSKTTSSILPAHFRVYCNSIHADVPIASPPDNFFGNFFRASCLRR